MFDIGWSEMAVIMLIALIVIGPKDLPRVARTIGRWVGKGRAMAREFQRAIEDMAKETELDTVKKEIEKVGRTDFGRSIEKTVDPTGELSKAFDPGADGGKTTAGKAAAGKAPAKAIPPAKTSTPAKTSAAVATAPGGADPTAATSSAGAESKAPAAVSPAPSATPSPAPGPALGPVGSPEAKPSERATVSAEPS